MPRRVAAFARIDRAVSRHQASLDRASRNLARTIPIARIARLPNGQVGSGRQWYRELVEQLVAIPTLGVIEGAVLAPYLRGEHRTRLVPLGARNQQASVRRRAVS